MSTDQTEGRVEEIREAVSAAMDAGYPSPKGKSLHRIREDAGLYGWIHDCKELLTEIDRLRAERDELKEALRRVTSKNTRWDENKRFEGEWIVIPEEEFLAARRALHTKGDGDD